MKCCKCKFEVELSFRFCPQCGQSLYIDLYSESLSENNFIEVLNSVYNLIITPNVSERDKYFHPISRMLIHKKDEIEYELECKAQLCQQFDNFDIETLKLQHETVNMRINLRSSNILTGYAIRTTEELITKKLTLPLSDKEIDDRVNSFLCQYGTEHIVKNISSNMSNKAEEKRILFIYYLQADNKHMNYFLNESMLERWFETILQTNVQMTIQSYLDAKITPKEDMITDEVLNDLVFGYCVKLSESLFLLNGK